MVRRETVLHKIRNPMLAVVHFNVTVWVAARLVKYNDVADLRIVGIR